MRITLPIDLTRVSRWGDQAPSSTHVGPLKHSVDFWCDEGTPIYAAAPGVVVWVKQDSNVGGPKRRYYFDGNRIVIRHQDGHYTAYEHLRHHGSKVVVGQRVRRGQVIGWSGNTGISAGPHLHFELFVDPSEDESEGQTVPVVFS